jgi:hypothetical protein
LIFTCLRRFDRLILLDNLDTGDDRMFKDEILEKIFADNEMQKIPIGCQSTAVNVMEHVLEEIKGGNPYATISELFTDN